MPPLWVKVCVNGADTVPVVVAGLVTVMVWQVMVRLYVGPVPVQPFASVTFTVIGNEPVWVGVPDRTPAADSVRPAGNVPLARLNEVAPMAFDCVKV